ncbi:MAG TPA: hypothetical protein VF765_13385 [Polyangiaceae bacterium]
MAANGKLEEVSGEERIRRWMRRSVRERPLVALGAAGALGLLVGGVVASRAARLLFLATVGYVANELWHRRGRLDLDDVIAKVFR